jgi:hypothetical protein
VLDGVWVVRTCCFKNLLKVVFGQSGAPLEITFSSCHELFIGVLDFLPDATVVGHRSEAAQMVLLPLLSALSPPFGASDGVIGGMAWPLPMDVPLLSKVKVADSLITRGMSGCDVEQILGGFGCS